MTQTPLPDDTEAIRDRLAGTGRPLKIVGVVAGLLLLVGGVSALHQMPSSTTLSCGNAKDDINRALANGPLAKIVKWSVEDIEKPTEISKTDTLLRCSAIALLNDGQRHNLGYTFTNHPDGKYYITVEDLDVKAALESN
jgi:hypothetical protein